MKQPTCLIVVSGARGSGKTTFAETLAQVLGVPRSSFGDEVRARAVHQGLGDTREVLQALGEQLVVESPREFCQAVLQRVNHTSTRTAIIEGVRHVEILQMLRDLVKPQVVFHVHLDSSEVVRLARLRARNRLGDQLAAAGDKHSTEIQLKDRLPAVADFVLDGELDARELAHALLQRLPC